MPKLKSVEVINFRGTRYLRVWQYAARGGKALALQVRLEHGQSPGAAFSSAPVREKLVKEYGLKGFPTSPEDIP